MCETYSLHTQNSWRSGHIVLTKEWLIREYFSLFAPIKYGCACISYEKVTHLRWLVHWGVRVASWGWFLAATMFLLGASFAWDFLHGTIGPCVVRFWGQFLQRIGRGARAEPQKSLGAFERVSWRYGRVAPQFFRCLCWRHGILILALASSIVWVPRCVIKLSLSPGLACLLA